MLTKWKQSILTSKYIRNRKKDLALQTNVITECLSKSHNIIDTDPQFDLSLTVFIYHCYTNMGHNSATTVDKKNNYVMHVYSS